LFRPFLPGTNDLDTTVVEIQDIACRHSSTAGVRDGGVVIFDCTLVRRQDFPGWVRPYLHRIRRGPTDLPARLTGQIRAAVAYARLAPPVMALKMRVTGS
jgi:hypothetical protein